MKKPSVRECAKMTLAQAWKEVTECEFEMESEYLFWPGRRFRLDFAKPEWKLAVEVEGVTWGSMGRHQTPKGMASDCEKYNELEIMGWTLLRFTTDMIRKEPYECVMTLIRGIEAAKEKAEATCATTNASSVVASSSTSTDAPSTRRVRKTKSTSVRAVSETVNGVK